MKSHIFFFSLYILIPTFAHSVNTGAYSIKTGAYSVKTGADSVNTGAYSVLVPIPAEVMRKKREEAIKYALARAKTSSEHTYNTMIKNAKIKTEKNKSEENNQA